MIDGVSDHAVGAQQAAPASSSTMIMDGLDTLTPQHHHHHASAFLLTESAAAAAAHFNVLSFDTCLYRSIGATGCEDVASPERVSAPGDLAESTTIGEPQPGDLNTPVTTSGDIPSFFGPSTVVEPPPITGQCSYLFIHCLLLCAYVL